MSTNELITTIGLYDVDITYHTQEKCSYKIYAPDEAMANQIAQVRFKDEHTSVCIMDSVTVNYKLSELNGT
jgi:hypothetical protein